MQELRSTEILDKEIQADARKKAEKILAKADADCQDLLDSLEGNIKKAGKEKIDLYEKKFDFYKRNQNASVPLEKERFEVSFVQSQLSKNINKYLEGLSEEKRLELVCKNVKVEKDVAAYVYGFDTKAAEKFLKKAFGAKIKKCEETIFGKIVVEEDCGLAKPQGIILEAEDNSARYRLTLSQIFSEILDKYRAELYQALFGNN